MLLLNSSVFVNFLLFVSFSLGLFYLWMKHRFGYWKRRGFHSLPASFPSGNLGPIVLQVQNLGDFVDNIYNQTKHHACAGLFMLLTKTLIINDLELIKKVLLKDQHHFLGHGFKSDKERDPLSQHLFNIEGEAWKRIRVKLTPTFTSSKIKYMFESISSCADTMLEYVKRDVGTGNTVEIKEVVAKFSTDVIGSCAFGIEMDSFKNPDAEFRKMGRKIFSTGFLKMTTDMLGIFAPSVMTTLRLSLNFPEVTKFFTRIVPETVKYRKDNNITRNDFLQLLIDMKNMDSKTGDSLTMEELTAQVFVFFIAGFETSSTTASYAFLELAKNPDVQAIAREEIERELAETGGKVTYDAVARMTYLTNVVQESLRMYPIVPFLSRGCTTDYPIPGTKLVIEKGTFIIIPVLGIQRDPEYFPDPEKFDPERFNPVNAAKRHAYAHIPFGEGPRICIGMRFGMLQVKLALITILLHFDVSLSDETKLPLEYDKRTFLLHTKGGLFLRLTPRN